jgi:hypothetical protein
VLLLTRSTVEEEAIKAVGICFSREEVKQVFLRYKSELTIRDETGSVSISEDFLHAVRSRLAGLRLSEIEIRECLAWLPPAPESLNIIILPDFSRRIIDEVNNPQQIENDLELLNQIWETFKGVTRLKMDSHDRLIVDVTDEDQAGGKFRNLANDLIFDLSTHRGQSNRLYFDRVGSLYTERTSQLYELARDRPLGADYWYYFNRKLSRQIRKSTLFESYRNLVIILTDGYLEAQSDARTGVWDYTGDYIKRQSVCNRMRDGQSVAEALRYQINSIPDCMDHYPELEVLVLEITERREGSVQERTDRGTPCDYEILKRMWSDWFTLLEIRNTDRDFFIARNDATKLTKERIERFIKEG